MRANAGDGKLLPGDVQKGDIKLFVYDGTNFYIEPDVSIPDDVTISIPGQYPQVHDALKAIGRKTVNRDATVTFKIAAGVFNANIVINHPSADKFVIKGTMLGAQPGWSEFS